MKKTTIISLLIISALVFPGCSKMFLPEPANNPEAIFDHVWTAFQEDYAPFEERHVDWVALYQVYRPQVTPTSTSDELYATICSMLTHLDDGHVYLVAPHRPIYHSNSIFREKTHDKLFDAHIVQSVYLEEGFKSGQHNSYYYGKIREKNIGYIHFSSIDANMRVLQNFLDTYIQADGYIIDLRHNNGGDFTYGLQELGRFTDKNRLVFKSKTKNGKGPNDYSAWFDWHLKPAKDYINKPVIVLVDQYTVSAAERLVLVLRTLPQVTILGDRTNGALSTKIARELANGWFYTISPQKVISADGEYFEGTGIPPHIYVQNTPADISQGKDLPVEAAIHIISP